MLKQATASYPAAADLSRQTKSHPRGLTPKRRPLYSARFATLAHPPMSEGPCGGTGRRARLKIEFRKECWFDSGQGHQALFPWLDIERACNNGVAKCCVSHPPWLNPLVRSLPANRAVQGVDQRLNLDELVAGPFGLVAVKRRGQHLRMHVPILEHALTGFLQRFKSLAHLGFFQQRGSAPRCQREAHAYTDPAGGAIDQWRGVGGCTINPSIRKGLHCRADAEAEG
jgi:hypothetical protein